MTKEFGINIKAIAEEDMITITKSDTADTRTCDVSNVTKEQLLASSKQHQGDVRKAIDYFREKLKEAADNHDFTKVDNIDEFFKDFVNNFETQDWYDMHKEKERHHIDTPEGRRDDINLFDVLEHIADCVMAGMGRAGKVTPLKIPAEVLEKAFQNTVEDLKSRVIVKEKI